MAVADAQIAAAAAFYCRGLSKAEIGRRLSRDEHTIAKWLDSRPDLVDSELRALVDPAASLRQHLPRATQAYGEALNSKRDSVKLQAAEAVYDRVYGKPLVRTLSEGRRDIRVLLLKASDLTTQEPS